ncbi:MAG: hypothetical protein IKG30_09400 [Clostridiales bacterium]|jgi:hypothetical protein|nr:hypothetical protein [Clostridiales bacterium]
MKCPFCSEEMKEGFVRSGATRAGLITRGSGSGFLYWTDDEYKAGLTSNGLKLHADQFDEFGLALTKAYMCDACKKVILDTYVEEK